MVLSVYFAKYNLHKSYFVNASPWWQIRKNDFSTSMASTFILHLNLLNGSIESVVYIKCLP